MKLKLKTLGGMIFSDEYDSVSEFLSLQQSDFPPLDDSHIVLEVEILGQSYPFTGNVGELYDELMEK